MQLEDYIDSIVKRETEGKGRGSFIICLYSYKAFKSKLRKKKKIVSSDALLQSEEGDRLSSGRARYGRFVSRPSWRTADTILPELTASVIRVNRLFREGGDCTFISGSSNSPCDCRRGFKEGERDLSLSFLLSLFFVSGTRDETHAGAVAAENWVERKRQISPS